MSDVNVNTSWTITPGGDYEYNGVLGCAGYDTENNRLFVSAQSPPNVAGNVRTEYARGFHMSANYNGDLMCSPAENTSTDLKKIRFTMSFAGSAYDLTDARVYCQFQNHFQTNIATWRFLHVAAETETETVLASGTNLAQRDRIQIDFINDYGAGQFYFECEYSGEIVYPKFYKIGVNDPVVKSGSNPGTNVGMVDYNRTAQGSGYYKNAPPAATMDVYMTLVTYNNTVYYFYKTRPYEQNHLCVAWRTYAGDTSYWYETPVHMENGYYYVATNNPVYIHNTFLSNGGYTYETLNDAIAAFTGAVSGGVDTTDFNNYDGKVYTCRMFANIANIAPGPMATESQGGTDGDFDISSDSLDIPDLPSEGVAISPRAGDLYLCNETVLGNLQRQLFDSNISAAIKDIFTNVPDCILSIMSFPLPTSAYTVRFASNIFAGGQDLGNTTETNVIKRYIEYDCGTVNLHLFWDSALDLNPYTKLNIFIPGVGMRPLDADICMSHDIGLKYHIDLLTGVCVAFITVDGDVYQQHTGNIGQQMAFSGTRNGQIMTGILSGLAGNASNVANMSNPISGASNLVATTLSAFKVPRTVIGNFGGSTAQLAVQQPYIEIERPIQQLPRDYTKYNAYPCYMTAQLINLSGWTEVQDIFIDDIDCTQAEREKLLNLLHNGVIL